MILSSIFHYFTLYCDYKPFAYFLSAHLVSPRLFCTSLHACFLHYHVEEGAKISALHTSGVFHRGGLLRAPLFFPILVLYFVLAVCLECCSYVYILYINASMHPCIHAFIQRMCAYMHVCPARPAEP